MFDNKTETKSNLKLAKLWVDSSGRLTNLSLDNKEIEVVKPFELKDKYLATYSGVAFFLANILVYGFFEYFSPETLDVEMGGKVIIYITTVAIIFTFLLLFFAIFYLLSFFIKTLIWQYKMKSR